MIIKNVNADEIKSALVAVNDDYDNNVIFNRFDCLNKKGTRFAVTLKTLDSRGKGSRRGFPIFKGFDKPPDWEKRRHLPSACWHVYGTFFDVLLFINEDAVIVTSGSLANPLPSNEITKDGGNWQDWVIGTYNNYPYMMSEACDCYLSQDRLVN